jgi:hypothetical protein
MMRTRLLQLCLGLAALVLSGSAASAQLHSSLRDTFFQPGSVYGDIWAEGSLVFLGHWQQNRIDILDVSDPDDVVHVSTYTVPVPDNQASAEDIQSADGLLFTVLEYADPNGAQIIDVRNPFTPQKLTNVDPEPGEFEQCHTLFHDAGWLYLANSSDNSIAIVDLRSYDPDNPPASITSWAYRLDNVGNVFVHDMTVQNGRLFAAAWDSLVVFDVSNLGLQAPQFRGSTRGLNTHSVWATDDGAFLVTAEEREGGALRLYEVVQSGPSVTLLQRDSYVAPREDSYCVHNPLMVGDRIYASFYQEGGVVLELDRTTKTMEVVGQYDTSAQVPTFFGGAWGIYPQLGADRVVVSDIENGFYVVDFSALQISWPEARPETADPYTPTAITAQLSAVGAVGLDPTSVVLHYRIDGGAVSTLPMSPIGGGQYTADLPGAGCGARIRYWVSADDLGGDTYLDPAGAPGAWHELYVASGFTTVFQDDFDSAGGWSTSTGGATGGAWTRADPFETAGQPLAGDPEGTPFCYFTGQGTNGGSDGEADVDGGPVTLTSPNMNFSAGDGLIRYSRWFFNDDADGDTLQVQISGNGGTNWTTVETVEDKAGGWIRRAIRVSDYVVPSASVRLRFLAVDNPNNSVTEAAVDEVVAELFSCTPAASHVVRNGNGTNPLGYAAVTEPVLGQDWLVSVDIATPGHLASIVSFGLGGPVSGPTLNGFLQGQLLVLGPLLPPDIAVGSHAIGVPLDLTLLGATLSTQGSTFTPGHVRLNNAIDATFGY